MPARLPDSFSFGPNSSTHQIPHVSSQQRRAGLPADDDHTTSGSHRPSWSVSGNLGNQRRRLDPDSFSEDYSSSSASPWGTTPTATTLRHMASSEHISEPVRQRNHRGALHHQKPFWKPKIDNDANSGSWSPISSTSSPISVKLEERDSSDDLVRFFADAVEGIGQLSIDDKKDVRYHGQASGLHLLARVDQATTDRSPQSESRAGSGPPDDHSHGRQPTGLWHFPPPGVWPPSDHTRVSSASASPDVNGGAKSSSHSPNPSAPRLTLVPLHDQGKPDSKVRSDESMTSLLGFQPTIAVLPSLQRQEMLLTLYFTHVHPVLPIVHKSGFLKSWRET